MERSERLLIPAAAAASTAAAIVATAATESAPSETSEGTAAESATAKSTATPEGIAAALASEVAAVSAASTAVERVIAAPLVAGVAALIRALRPDLSAADVDTILCSTAVKALPFWDLPEQQDPRVEPLPECGLVDAAAALAYAQIYDPALEDDYETGDFSRWSKTGSP